ncbi:MULTISPECIES: anti-sigma factor [unclassified Kaistella]|uniref:anti-sigma factor n=1 Tax=unclassified Kaistella TaxID=2762626 RepID=UPI002732AA4F|nr:MULTISPECIES: anti-sigma factor [unclassified Kaistella]MDP2454674.1 anti-sigma factor [Kaistella sp. SH11-4b]MDP2457411.1 anti-sigma factor [Kaistella sp. SH40-3]MDP2460171.1 anti-sigma factor [Kaistella sp. SH19-2b]
MDIKTYISSGVIEAYAMGNLSSEESSILECVMKNNAEVQVAVFEAQQTFEKLATEQAIEPASYLQDAIRSKLEFGNAESSDGKIIPLNQKTTTKTTTNNFPLWMKAASVAVLFGLGYLGYEVGSKSAQIEKFAQNNTELSNKVSSLEEMNTMLMNSRRIQLKGVEKHPDMLAEVYWDSSNKVYLDIKNLPAAPTGRQYQLWAIVDGKPVDMGMYSEKKNGTIQPMKSVEKPQAFAITLEKEGGNATPTMEEMYVMGTI